LKKKMAETDAILGGEFSGHICIADKWFGVDDGLYAGARLLEILSHAGNNLDEMLATLPRSVSTPEILIKLGEERKFEVVSAFRKKVARLKAEIIDLDGIRLELPGAWGLVRASNTSPAITLRFEARNLEQLERIKNYFKTHLQEIDPTIDF